jgi:peptide/nickel transport system substrate-binding protein
VGSGRYKVNDEKTGLVINNNYYGAKSEIKKINLINAPDRESVAHYVEIGAADIYFNNVSSDEIIRMSGEKIDINSNNMVYIGINRNYGVLGENALRQALSSGLDRQKLCRDAFYNNALPATGFFNPVWEPVKAVQNIQITAKNEITVENLEKIGYNNLDNGKKLQLTLLVNSENRLRVAAAYEIANQLKDFGIKITVIEKSYEQYKASLSSGNFQLFLGETRLTDNMDISSMITKGSSAAFGIKEGETSEEVVINGLYSGSNSIADVAAVLQSEMPFIPLCYKTGVLFYSDSIENVKNSSASDIYFSIESYIVK